MYSYLIFVDTVANSNKFWSAEIQGSLLTVKWGRVGYKGQSKVHSCRGYDGALSKFNELVADKKAKGYSESKAQMDGDRTGTDIRRAIQLLDIIRQSVANKTFNDSYTSALNEYLKIVPTPLGMQIHLKNIYRTAADVDYQRDLLNSLLNEPEPIAVTTVLPVKEVEPKTISLKTISKSFWRHLS